MDSEKFKQSVMTVDEGKKSTSTSLVLAVSLAVVTVALVLLAVLGSIYVVSLQRTSGKDDTSPKYQVRHDDDDRSVLEDRKDQLELIKNKDASGHLVSLVVLDYNARMISIYMPKEEKCFLIGGIVKEIGSFEDDVPINVVKDAQQSTNDNTDEIDYVINDQNPIQKTSLLAKDVVPYCSNTNTMWLERRETEAKQTRQKRGWSISISITISISF